MITLARLSGKQFVLNADLIERIDATPDTVVTLTDGTKYVVADSLDSIVAAVMRFRSEIVALSWQLDPTLSTPAPSTVPAQARLAPVTPFPGPDAHATDAHSTDAAQDDARGPAVPSFDGGER